MSIAKWLLMPVICLVVLCASTGSSTARQESKDLPAESGRDSSAEDKANRVLNLLKQCPTWTDTALTDQVTRDKITGYLNTISKEDTETIRDAIKLYMKNARGHQGDRSVERFGTVFILLIYIFDVPDSSPKNEGYPSGFFKPSIDADHYNSLWPFTRGAHNELKLTESFAGYEGPPFRYLDAFDYYHIMNGRRDDSVRGK